MDLDPTSGRPGTIGPGRNATALATEARRAIVPPEVEREAVARTTERAAYATPGFRPAGDATRDVVLQLSQKALALAKSAAERPPGTKSVEREEDPLHRTQRRSERDEPARPRVNIRV